MFKRSVLALSVDDLLICDLPIGDSSMNNFHSKNTFTTQNLHSLLLNVLIGSRIII